MMAGGYCLGTVLEWDAHRRQSLLVRMGLALAAAFVVVRVANIYGDPVRWSHQASPVFTVLSFLNVTKYPPSLDFLLMTLGPAMVVMAWLETFQFHFTNRLIVFGRVPFFYYGAHLRSRAANRCEYCDALHGCVAAFALKIPLKLLRY